MSFLFSYIFSLVFNFSFFSYVIALGKYFKTGDWSSSRPCHCCFLKLLRNESAPSLPTDCREKYPKSSFNLGGMLYLPQWDCLIPTSFESMSVHALGAEPGSIGDSYHCVLPKGTWAPINRWFSDAFVSKVPSSYSSAWKYIKIDVPIKLPYGKGQIIPYECHIVVIPPSSRKFNPTEWQGRNNPPEEWLKEATVYDLQNIVPSSNSGCGMKSNNRIVMLLGM